jgi:hypothetical protein
LLSLRARVEESRNRFSDEAFGDFFQRRVAGEIDEAALLMDCFIRVARTLTPVPKSDTIHLFLNEILKRDYGILEGKQIHLSREFEEDLPETTLPDRHLRFVLDSILQYAFAAIPSRGGMRIVTKSSPAEKGPENDLNPAASVSKRLEIRVTLSGQETGIDEAGRTLRTPLFKTEGFTPLELRLAGQMVRGNHGVMGFKADEKTGETSILLSLFVERRKFLNESSVMKPGQEDARI